MKNYILILVAALCFGWVGIPGAMAQQEQAVTEPDESVVWNTMSNTQKINVITDTIAKLKDDKGIMIRKEPGFYVSQINAVYLDNPTLNDGDVGSVFRMLAITFRDFDNGQDPEELIRLELGEELYQKSVDKKMAVEEIYQEYLNKKKK